jgi:hypothetical protein
MNRSSSPTITSSSPLPSRRQARSAWRDLCLSVLTPLSNLQDPMIQLGQICSVNILSDKEKPFSNYEFFPIGTAARVYCFVSRFLFSLLLVPCLVLSCLSSLTSASLTHSPPCRLNPSCLDVSMHSYNINFVCSSSPIPCHPFPHSIP